MDTVLYYMTENGENFIVADENNIYERIKEVENSITFIKWDDYSLYLIKELIKQHKENK